MIRTILITFIFLADRVAIRLETERRRKAVKAQRRAAVQDLIAELERARCVRAPAGWICTRRTDHTGPCAAVPR